MNTTEYVLIDLSSIAHPIWHMCGSNPDQNACSTQIVARVLALANGHEHVAICCDSGKSFRHDLSGAYKANRPEREEALHHQIALAVERLAADGFPIWGVKGFEADDVIATAAARALEIPDATVLVVSADKDLLQLVGPRVRAMSSTNGTVYDEAAVVAKFGVKPEQMRDYLTLVGDASDNIKGAKGIGGKKAASLLTRFGNLDDLYRAITGADQHGAPSIVSVSEFTALKEFQPSLGLTRSLVTLRQDVDLPFDAITTPRTAKAVEAAAEWAVEADDDSGEDEPLPEPARPTLTEVVPPATNGPGAALEVRPPQVLIGEPVEWERGLDPRTMKDARIVARDLFESRLFSAYGTPQAVLSTIMVGRELGLPAMGSLRSIHIIEGKHSLSASLMVALVLKSGMAEYFDPIEFDEQHAVFETKRKGGRNPVRLTHTTAMAMAAGLVKDKSGWMKNPTDMCVARAQSRLARLVYPDLLAGLYTPEELEDIRDENKAVA